MNIEDSGIKYFFNDPEAGEYGEGANLNKGNNFSEYIGEKNGYSSIRKLIWDNLDKYLSYIEPLEKVPTFDNRLGELILEWLDIGSSAFEKASVAQQANTYDKVSVGDDNLFELIKKNSKHVQKFTPELVKSVETVEKAKKKLEEEGDQSITETDIIGGDDEREPYSFISVTGLGKDSTSVEDLIKEDTFSQLNIKEDSNRIYNELKKIFDSI